MNKLLAVIEKNARLTLEELAAITCLSTEEVAQQLDAYKKQGVIRATRTLIDWDKIGGNGVQALIEVRVSPKKGHGFDEVAETIAQLDEVDSVLLMSGGYDLSVTISGSTFHDVAQFVARRLSPLDDVLSTSTHFVLRTYKKDGALYSQEKRDERESTLL